MCMEIPAEFTRFHSINATYIETNIRERNGKGKLNIIVWVAI